MNGVKGKRLKREKFMLKISHKALIICTMLLNVSGLKNKRWKNNIPLLFYAVFRNEKNYK